MLKPGTLLLSIDPGLQTSGYSIISIGDRALITMLESHYLAMSSSKSVSERVALFHDFFQAAIAKWRITDVAIETPFLGKNAQNFLKLGYLRGIIYLLVAQRSLALHEFTPMQVKQAVTGTGGASKEQVAHMILKLFPRMQAPKKHDVTDAIAVGLCAVWHQKKLSLG
jgi:crossover junction endodeoxyribonuclease RuvC